jgi:hypothetical protein
MATYRLAPLGILEIEPLELDDGSVLHELVAALQAPSASRAGVSVRGEPALPDDTALDLTDQAMSTLGDDELLVDWEPCELGSEPAVRTLVLIQLGGVATVVLEQWRLVAAGERWVVTATADLAAWPRLAPGLRGVIATLEVAP